MKKIVQCKFVRLLTFAIFFVICINANTRVIAQELMQISNHSGCQKILHECLSLEKVTQQRQGNILFHDKNVALISFETEINLIKLREVLSQNQHNKMLQRQIVQEVLKQHNDTSIEKYQEQINNLVKDKVIVKQRPISITNALLIKFRSKDKSKIINLFKGFHNQTQKRNHSTKNIQSSTQSSVDNKLKDNSKQFQRSGLLDQQFDSKVLNNNTYIALIDSGVSINHQELSHLQDFKQYNPKENTYKVKDTGFGHGTGVLSLLAASNQYQRTISTLPQANYLSCNGLPSGKYNYIWVVSCFDWLLQQPKVDIVVNSWLQPDLNCSDELLYPLQALWLANTIPLFAAGNFGQSNPSTRDPVNFNLFDDVPLISVGAVNAESQPLSDSSFGDNVCGNGVKSPTISAPGENLTVASPFQKDSYQIATGTSYSVTLIATSLAKLIEHYPSASHKLIVESLISTAQTARHDHDKTLKLPDLEAALEQLTKKVQH